MNSHQAAAAAKNELPIVYKYHSGNLQVFRRIRALTYIYHPEKRVSVLLEDRNFQQANIWADLVQIEAIDSCEECPDQDRTKCGKCRFNNRRDNFTCKECSMCAHFQNNCRDWNNGRLCGKYGDCMSCMNSGEFICCDICVYRKKGSEDNDEQEDQGLSQEQGSTFGSKRESAESGADNAGA